MTVQPHLFPESPDRHASPPPPPGPARPASDTRSDAGSAPVWLQRISLFILVVFCVYLGVIVTVVPWWTSLWDHNLFFAAHPRLWSVLRLAPVRGVISGLGLLDIWIGISEAVNYREHRR